MSNIVEIEIDNPRNAKLYFAPLGRSLRGGFDFQRVAEPLAKMQTNTFPRPIPGQRIGIDVDSGDAWIAEPLRDAAHDITREKIERRGCTIPPAREEIRGVDAATFLYWMRRAVESGHAKVCAGKFPGAVAGKPRTNFFSAERESQEDKLAAAIERQTAALNKQSETLVELVRLLAKKS